MAEPLRQQLATKAILTWDPIRLAPYYSVFFLWWMATGAHWLARPLYASELGASVFLIVVISASNGVAQLITGPLTGFVSDRIGRKPLMLLGNAIRGAFQIGQFFAENYWQFLLFEFIGAMGVAMFITSSSVIMADLTTRENRGRLLAIRTMTQRIGLILGPISGVVIASFFHGDLRYMFLYSALVKVFIHLLIVYKAKETAPEANRPASTLEKRVSRLELSFFKTKAFFALVLTAFALNMMAQNAVFGALFPVIANEKLGLGTGDVGELISLAGFIALIFSYPNGWVVDRLGRKVSLIPGLIILALSAVLITQMNGMMVLYLMITLWAVGTTMSQGASQAFAMDMAPAEHRGSFLGIWSFVGTVGGITASLVIGAVASQFGYGPGFGVVAFCLLTSAVFMFRFGPESGAKGERQPSTPTAALIVGA